MQLLYKRLTLWVFVGACLGACNTPTSTPTASPTFALAEVTPTTPATANVALTLAPSATTVAASPTATFAPALSATTPAPNATPCATNWFFTLASQLRALALVCPVPVLLLAAVGQDFEGGRVYRYAPDPAYPLDQRGTIYIIYNRGDWITIPDTWDPSQPANDPTLTPPAGRYQPTDGIGKVWREVAEVRTNLGWAYETASAFQGRLQYYFVAPGVPSAVFIDHGKWGTVLRLNAVDMGPNTWEVAGSYP